MHADLPQKTHIFLKQGDLDSLCGVYALINSAILMFPYAKLNTTVMFSVLIKCLGIKIQTIITEGVGSKEIADLMKQLASHLRKNGCPIRFAPAYKKRDTPDLKSWWTTTLRHFNRHGPGSVILRMSGLHDHLTCVYKMTSEMIILGDSGHLDIILRRTATTGKPTATRKYVMIPSETFLLKTYRTACVTRSD